MKRLSIIIPVYNVADYLKKCIRSIVQQGLSVSDYEIIIIDDGSTDDSASICDKLKSEHQNIQVIHKPNGGVSSARNCGLSVASAEYIMFIDPDDFLEDNSLKPILQEINPEVDISIYRSFEVIDGNKQKEFPPFNTNLCNRINDGKPLYVNGVYSRFVVWSTLFKTSFIKANNLSFIEGMANGEDAVFMAFAFICNPRIQICDNPLYCVNVRPGSASRDWDQKRVNRMIGNIRLLEEKRLVDDKLNCALVDYLIYNNISCVLDYICNSHMPMRAVIDTCINIKALQTRKLRTWPLKRAKIQISILNTSIYLFAFIKIILNSIRR